MLTRRSVLAAGGALVAAGVVVGGVELGRRRAIPLTAEALTPLVGTRFRTGDATLTLTAVTGLEGPTPRHEAFRLVFTTHDTADLPGATRVLEHRDGDLAVHLGPVGAERTDLEAVVNRTV